MHGLLAIIRSCDDSSVFQVGDSESGLRGPDRNEQIGSLEQTALVNELRGTITHKVIPSKATGLHWANWVFPYPLLQLRVSPGLSAFDTVLRSVSP